MQGGKKVEMRRVGGGGEHTQVKIYRSAVSCDRTRMLCITAEQLTIDQRD